MNFYIQLSSSVNSFIEKNLTEKFGLLNKYTFLLFILTLGFPDRIIIYALDLWIVVNVLNSIVNYKILRLRFSPIFLFSILLFILTLTLTIISNDKDTGRKLLETRISFIVFPLLFSIGTVPQFSKAEIHKTIALGFFFILIFILIKTLLLIFSKEWEYALFNSDFPVFLQNILDKHRTYWGIYTLLVFVSLIFLYTNEKSGIFKIIYFLEGLVLVLSIYFLEARIIYFSLLILIVAGIVAYFRKNIKILFIFGVSALIIGIIGLISMPRFSLLVSGFDSSIGSLLSADSRSKIWEAGYLLLKDNWIFGVGIDNIESKLIEGYELVNFTEGVQQQFNAHNQFLQGWLEGGIISLLVYIGLFIYPLILSIKKKDFVVSILYVLLFMISVFETTLNRFSGVIIVSLLPVIYVFGTLNSEQNNEFRAINKIFKTLFFVLVILIIVALLVHRKFDPKDPITYGINKHTRIDVHNLGLKEVPEGTFGYMLDSTSNFKRNGRYAFSYTPFYKTTNLRYDSIKITVWCYVSEFCNVNQVGIAAGNNTNKFKQKFFNLKKSNTWQYIELKEKVDKGLVSATLVVVNNNHETFNNLTGFIVFAYPNYILY